MPSKSFTNTVYRDAGLSSAGFGGADWEYLVVGMVACGGAEIFENTHSKLSTRIFKSIIVKELHLVAIDRGTTLLRLWSLQLTFQTL